MWITIPNFQIMQFFSFQTTVFSTCANAMLTTRLKKEQGTFLTCFWLFLTATTTNFSQVRGRFARWDRPLQSHQQNFTGICQKDRNKRNQFPTHGKHSEVKLIDKGCCHVVVVLLFLVFLPCCWLWCCFHLFVS